MKNFLLSAFLFATSFIFLCFMLGSVQLPDRYIICKTQGSSFEKLAWNLRQLNEQPDKIRNSMIILGPSLVQAGVCDSTLNANGIRSINFGTNGPGNEVELYFLERVLAFKPKRVLLHFNKAQHTSLHNMTPLLYSPSKLLASGQSLNFTFAAYLIKRVSYVLDYFVWKLFGLEPNLQEAKADFGVRYDKTAIPAEKYSALTRSEMREIFESFHLEKNNFIRESEKDRSGLYFDLVRLWRKVLHMFRNTDMFTNCGSQQRFQEQAERQCAKNKVKLSHLYLPVVADARSGKGFGPEFYSPQNITDPVTLDNFTFLDSNIYWADQSHLSKKGCIEFTRSLLTQQLLKHDTKNNE